jgi:hypothetical protein
MRLTRRLNRLCSAAEKRFGRLRSEAASVDVHKTSLHEVEETIAHVTIDVLNARVNFIRAYYLSGMLSARLVNGCQITVGVSGLSIDNAIGQAVLYWKPRTKPSSSGVWHRRDEPTWHDPNRMLPVFRHLGFSNLTDIEAANSSGTRVFVICQCFAISLLIGTHIPAMLLSTWLQ